jgi:CxxC motif-containing protein (DUF1111 family)
MDQPHMAKNSISFPAALLTLIGILVSQAQGQLSLQTGVVLSWPTTTNNIYQPQWSPNSSGSWNILGVPSAGTGASNSLYDPYPNGSRSYQVLEMVPGSAPVATLPANGGFESGSGIIASNWTVTTAAGGPVYGIRTNDNPHSGGFDFQIHLASTGSGPVVEFTQANVPVTGGTTYPLTFYADALAGSAGYNAQWRVLWSLGGDTGYQTFSPGTAQYGLITNSLTAPTGATSATVFFHFAGAAVSSQSATIDLDDVALGTGFNAGSPGSTNTLAVTVQPVAQVSWPTTSGTLYYPEASLNLAVGSWVTNAPMVTGDGTTHSLLFPMTNNPEFFRLYTPPVVILPPSSLQQTVSGSTNAIGLAWIASPSSGVTGYEILYSTNGGPTNSLNVGNVNSAIISSLTPGQSYNISVITLTANGSSALASNTLSAQPDATIGIVPLYGANTVLEPDTLFNTSTGLVTWISDRPRGRHARENGPSFSLYDTYLPFYWEQRMTTIQIIDTISQGGSTITFNFRALNGLDTPNIRFFFQGQTTVAQYADNLYATSVDPITLTNWTTTISQNINLGRAIQAGDRIEFEFSPFMVTATNGQLNYYGGAILYVAGQGIVPWQAAATSIDLNPANDGPVIAGVRTNIDSYPLPTNAWLAGADTMPYQYSGETNHMFNQMSPFASPPTGESFLLGRRLHETDFLDGTHAEAGNPVYTEMVGKLGAKFSNVSCVSCHVNNGRALPPAIGAPMIQSLVRVGSDASGTPDPVLGSILSPQATTGVPEDTVVISGYTTINGQYGDGTAYTLQQPNYTFGGYTPAFYSVRLAPQLVGMGLLEAVSESAIQALAEADDAGTNGILGNLQTVADPQSGQLRLGRFGEKAGKASIMDQIAGALNSDMGVTTSIFPILDGATTNGPIGLADSYLTNWNRYISCLGVNARRSLNDTQCLQGEQLFASANCVQCHTPTLQTSAYAPFAELRNQTIHPYTDLLLHDMGPGLADNMGEGNATGSEWRTPPLWSIGLTPGVSGGEAYLHDGRARTLAEAILWHGGEATAAREAFRTMSATDRAALIAFLKSL